jgi:hypothetical protein
LQQSALSRWFLDANCFDHYTNWWTWMGSYFFLFLTYPFYCCCLKNIREYTVCRNAPCSFTSSLLCHVYTHRLYQPGRSFSYPFLSLRRAYSWNAYIHVFI